jgi:hypothetical protein
MNRCIRLLPICAVLAASSSGAQCLRYEPEPVAISGVLSTEVHPGPPEYLSIERGDRPETIWVVTLDAPICISESVEPNSAEANVVSVQLVLSEAQVDRHRALVGEHVTVAGTLFHAVSGHHRRPILITVASTVASEDFAGVVLDSQE